MGHVILAKFQSLQKHYEDVLIPESGQSMGRLHTVYMCHS